MSTNLPIVSVCCLVYNHEPYLRECFEGFVMQQTTFPIEILVHDDASTDHSADIIREYTKKYPDLFKPIYQTENQYSKGVEVFSLNARRAQGKYIAVCEGDDYWTDPLKLQKQVDFLEANPDFSLCFHNVKVWKQKEGVMVDDFITRDVPSETDIYELAKGNYIHTPSVVFRNDKRVFDSISKMGKLGVGDYPMWMLCAQYGKIKKFDECMAVYRFGSGVWSGGNSYKNRIMLLTMGAKLMTIIDDEKVKMILEKNIQQSSEQVVELYQSILNSHAFRIGRFLLKPFQWAKILLKKLKNKVIML